MYNYFSSFFFVKNNCENIKLKIQYFVSSEFLVFSYLLYSIIFSFYFFIGSDKNDFIFYNEFKIFVDLLKNYYLFFQIEFIDLV